MSTTGKVSKIQKQEVDIAKKEQKQKLKVTSSTINEMNDENAKAYEILNKEGSEAAVKHMFNPTGKRQLTYAEMRMRFG